MRSLTVAFAVIAVVAQLLAAQSLLAQGTKADYDRAAKIERKWNNAYSAPDLKPQWISGSALWYTSYAHGQPHYTYIDGATGASRPLFNHQTVAQSLNLDPKALNFDRLEVNADRALALSASGTQIWSISLNTSTATIAEEAQARRFQLSPLNEPVPSRVSTLSTAIILKNTLATNLSIFWVDSEGRRQPYASLPAGETRRQHTFSGHTWIAIDEAGKTQGIYQGGPLPAIAIFPAIASDPRTPANDTPLPGRAAPDNSCSIIQSNHNLELFVAATAERKTITTDGTAADSFDGRPIFSPDSKHAVVMRTQPAQRHPVHTIESSPRDQLQPRLHTQDYLKPGDQIAVSKPWLISLPDGAVSKIDDALFPAPWDLSHEHWLPDSSEFSFVYNQRGHQLMRLLAVNALTGAVRTVIDEPCTTFFDYSSKLLVQYLDTTSEVIWASERDGFNHLYLYDLKTGSLKNQITKGNWVFRGIDSVDEPSRQITFRASGIIPGQDPYYIHFARINFDGTGLTVLTQGDGTHQVEWSPDRSHFLDRYSRVDMAPVLELRSAEGKLISELSRTDAATLSSAGWKPPERFVAKGRDGTTDIYGIIIRPSNFDPSKKYPVIENIYAGPHDSFTPKSFKVWYGHQQEIAELGFIVVQLDGMGTNNRGKVFHDICFKNLADSGFPDRIAWIKAAAAKHPEMDLSRVGIYGGSAGGQSAMRALIDHHDFYKAAAADCGCHDNRMDKIWWNEAWMSYPVDASYEACSNVAQAHKLEGKLLLTVGELDTNVDPASTMQVVDALIRANKDFDFLIIPGAGHGASESNYGRRRRQDFFVRNLLNVEPRAD